MKQDIPVMQPLDVAPENKLSKIRRLAQSEPSAYSSAKEVDAYIKQQRDDWSRDNTENITKS